MITTVLLFIAILAILILVHEFGHFITAKIARARVEEFGIGFPPRIFQKKRGETTYSINLLPIGGFVKIYGEDGEENENAELLFRFLDEGDALSRHQIGAVASLFQCFKAGGAGTQVETKRRFVPRKGFHIVDREVAVTL